MDQNLEPCFQIQALLSTSSAPRSLTYKMKELGQVMSQALVPLEVLEIGTSVTGLRESQVEGRGNFLGKWPFAHEDASSSHTRYRLTVHFVAQLSTSFFVLQAEPGSQDIVPQTGGLTKTVVPAFASFQFATQLFIPRSHLPRSLII